MKLNLKFVYCQKNTTMFNFIGIGFAEDHDSFVIKSHTTILYTKSYTYIY